MSAPADVEGMPVVTQKEVPQLAANWLGIMSAASRSKAVMWRRTSKCREGFIRKPFSICSLITQSWAVSVSKSNTGT